MALTFTTLDSQRGGLHIDMSEAQAVIILAQARGFATRNGN